ncbi:MAG: hypothetical protein IJF46_06100 [Bacteroidaceae bacterium]|nr:hypothetical protein [Bacteroidaceae bacterium]MBR3855635.1 hypothetical protein [Bacteroidaceae bacterium]
MKKTLTLLMLSTLLISCGSVKVHVNNDHTYSRKTPITINKAFNDDSDALGELQYLLQSNGYKLMSYGSAKKAFNLDSNYGQSHEHSEITYTHEFNSLYILDLDYDYYFDLFYYAFTRFSATITDLRSGEIIMTAHFRGDKSCKAVLKEFVNKLNSVIK